MKSERKKPMAIGMIAGGLASAAVLPMPVGTIISLIVTTAFLAVLVRL